MGELNKDPHAIDAFQETALHISATYGQVCKYDVQLCRGAACADRQHSRVAGDLQDLTMHNLQCGLRSITWGNV